MASVQEQARLQVVRFNKIWKSQRVMAKTTIYRIMKRYEQEGSVAKAAESGRPANKMTREK